MSTAQTHINIGLGLINPPPEHRNQPLTIEIIPYQSLSREVEDEKTEAIYQAVAEKVFVAELCQRWLQVLHG